MADDWIKFRKKLPTDGRVLETARKCNASSVTVLGALVTLWCIGDDHCDENGLLRGYTKDDIDRLCGVPNFCNSLPPDWFAEISGTPQLPEYQEHNGTTGKQRAVTAKRVAKHRKCNAAIVTREEKRREEKKKEKKEAPRPAAVRFCEPTVEEVRAYCRERRNRVDPEAFVDFYTAKGWRVGQQPMKCWRAAVRTWEKRDDTRRLLPDDSQPDLPAGYTPMETSKRDRLPNHAPAADVAGDRPPQGRSPAADGADGPGTTGPDQTAPRSRGPVV
ncbi:MAG: hypothetical protein ACE15C_20090 [Phycisphaerae bacterium]